MHCTSPFNYFILCFRISFVPLFVSETETQTYGLCYSNVFRNKGNTCRTYMAEITHDTLFIVMLSNISGGISSNMNQIENVWNLLKILVHIINHGVD